MKKSGLVISLAYLAGCAEMQWQHPMKNEQDFFVDSANCKSIALAIPLPPDRKPEVVNNVVVDNRQFYGASQKGINLDGFLGPEEPYIVSSTPSTAAYTQAIERQNATYAACLGQLGWRPVLKK